MSVRLRLSGEAGLEGELVRRAMLALARYACGEAGRNQGDPVYEAVTEGRQRYARYSSCGDLPHWALALALRHFWRSGPPSTIGKAPRADAGVAGRDGDGSYAGGGAR